MLYEKSANVSKRTRTCTLRMSPNVRHVIIKQGEVGSREKLLNASISTYNSFVLGIPTFLNEKSAETTPFLDILPKLPKLDIFASVYYGKCLFFEVLGRYYGKSLERLLF